MQARPGPFALPTGTLGATARTKSENPAGRAGLSLGKRGMGAGRF
jgi:hypothetical protein